MTQRPQIVSIAPEAYFKYVMSVLTENSKLKELVESLEKQNSVLKSQLKDQDLSDLLGDDKISYKLSSEYVSTATDPLLPYGSVSNPEEEPHTQNEQFSAQKSQKNQKSQKSLTVVNEHQDEAREADSITLTSPEEVGYTLMKYLKVSKDKETNLSQSDSHKSRPSLTKCIDFNKAVEECQMIESASKNGSGIIIKREDLISNSDMNSNTKDYEVNRMSIPKSQESSYAMVQLPKATEDAHLCCKESRRQAENISQDQNASPAVANLSLTNLMTSSCKKTEYEECDAPAPEPYQPKYKILMRESDRPKKSRRCRKTADFYRAASKSHRQKTLSACLAGIELRRQISIERTINEPSTNHKDFIQQKLSILKKLKKSRKKLEEQDSKRRSHA